MPVTEKASGQEALYQRAQYAKGGLGRAYWDYRDKVALSYLDENDKRIADIGCGEGITLEKVVARFGESEVVGVDFLRENIDICVQHGLPAKRGDVYGLDFAEGSLDAVLLFEVIEHLERPEAALLEISRVVKPGGKVVVIFPNDAFFKFARLATLKWKEAAYDPGHVRQWTPGEASGALMDAGFVAVRTRSVPFVLWPLSLHCVVTARKRAGDGG